MKDMNEKIIREHRIKGVKFPPRPWLGGEEFSNACLVFIRVCVDVFFFNREKETIYLAYRIIPIQALMGFGGAVNPGEDFREAGSRIIKQDTGLEIPSKELYYLHQSRCIYQAYGDPRDSLVFQFSCEVKSEQIKNIKLNPKEYDVGEGVQPFNKGQLMQERSLLHPGVENIFNLIFP